MKDGIYISGANREGYHTKGIMPGKHFDAEWHDIHVAKKGDICAKCDSIVEQKHAIEIGNIFKLGIKYSHPLKAWYLDENGKEMPIVMGSYGIGPARIAAAAIEENNDKDGMIWPESIAPFHAEVIPLAMNDEGVMGTAQDIYNELRRNGIDALMDDRDERPGVKFKDADLIGIPWQVIIGKKTLTEGMVECKSRKSGETEKVPPSNVLKTLKKGVA